MLGRTQEETEAEIVHILFSKIALETKDQEKVLGSKEQFFRTIKGHDILWNVTFFSNFKFHWFLENWLWKPDLGYFSILPNFSTPLPL